MAGFMNSVVQSNSSREHGELAKLDLRAGIANACSWGALAVSLPTTLISSFEKAPTTEIRDVDRDYELTEPASPRF
jgi:1-phosphofructokinase